MRRCEHRKKFVVFQFCVVIVLCIIAIVPVIRVDILEILKNYIIVDSFHVLALKYLFRIGDGMMLWPAVMTAVRIIFRTTEWHN